ncbi:condensin complex subunit 1-like isoform X2 [Hylaeus volcanicus]|uniref:condensin complex subunit 1-like isoform X2 n=1 Tax=Hylaeus volcanicus TaxID=313075 RepID=UPI0023B855B9|nr:condensin complex subunit 1-like isoform X2 [Hylaeus volcanicus]
MIKDFVIPLNKDELLQTGESGRFFVEKLVPVRMLSHAFDEARKALQANGINFILEHFDTFFSILIHGNKIELAVVMQGFSRIHKAITVLVHDLEGVLEGGNELEDDECVRFFNITKMLVYLFSGLICHIDAEIVKSSSSKYVEKSKKNTKSDIEEEWDTTKEKALEYSYRLLQLPLQKLWRPSIVEDAFIMLLTKMCYKILEHCKDSKDKHVRQTIFEILGISIKKYNHGMDCVIRIIQLLKLHNTLATHIANGVIHMVDTCGCNGLMKEVIKEIDQSEPSESESRCISIFLETIANTKPNLIIPILDDVMDYLGSEHYTLRNCAISVIGVIVQKVLTGDDLTQEQKDQRDECLNSLLEHILDVHAYVRSKVLQVWQTLCCVGAIPLARQANPFAAKLNKEEISKSLEKEEMKLRNMQTKMVSKSARGDSQRLELWNTLLPEIRKALKEISNDTTEKSKKRDKGDESEEEEENDDDEENFNPDTAFENVRQLMLKGEIFVAVKYLWKACTKLKQNPNMNKFSFEAKEEFLFLLLLKTFMESENNENNAQVNANTAQSADKDREKQEVESQKRLVNYLRNCLVFANELEIAIPMAEKLLFSTTAGDAIEACTLLGTAYQFGVAGAEVAIRDALSQVFHQDLSVRNNVAVVYKDIYLSTNEKVSDRQKALLRVKALIELLKGLKPGQSQALNKLILTWYGNSDLGSEELQVLWGKFSMKSSDTDPLDSRTALMLITMIGQAQDGILTENLDVLIKVGMGPRAKTDLLLARDTCRALMKIKNTGDDAEKSPIRYPNDHEMFREIVTLLIENFTNTKEDGYVSFATDAINAIYQLANQPAHLMEHVILEVCNRGKFNNNDKTLLIPSYWVSKFLYLVGHIAIREMVHLDTSVYSELKRRETIRKSRNTKKSDRNKRNTRKSSTVNKSFTTPNSARQMIRNKEASIVEDNGEEAVEGAADDEEAELINNVLENHIVTGDGLLTKFVPLVLHVCQNPNKYNDEDMQQAGTLALSKMMTVSSIFCKENLQLLITILERSPYPRIRANVLIGIMDLASKFPNEVEPWMKHIYGRLRDKDTHVRSTCVRVLSSLIMRDMVRIRGQISELALCIVDEDFEIRESAKQFFGGFSQKSNALYNIMPDILSQLTDPNLDISESDFREVLKHILGLLQKEKQIETIIDRICVRFQLATTERQWRDFSYCLSLLQFGPKSIQRLIECLPLLKEKIYHQEVLKALQNVVEQCKKKPNTKVAGTELEEKIEELLKGRTENGDNEIMPPPQAPVKRNRVKRLRRKSSSDEEDDDANSDPDAVPPVTKHLRATPSTSKKLPSRNKDNNSSAASVSRNRKSVSTPSGTPKRTSARLSQSRTKQ